MSLIESYDESFDPELKQKTKDESMKSCLKCCFSMRRLNAELKQLDDLKKHITSQMASKKKELEGRREFITSQMSAWKVDKHKDAVFTISRSTKEKAVITDESKIPDKYFDTVPVLQKTLLKKYLFDAVQNDGELIDGVELKDVESIKIRGLK